MHSVFCRTTRDHEQHLFYCKKDLDLHENHPEIAKEKMHQYVSAISNFSLAQLELRQYDECYQTLLKLKSVATRSAAIRLKIDSIYYPRLLAVFLYSGNFEKINDHIAEVKHFLDKHKGQFNMSKEINFYWNAAYCYFGIANYKEALRWLNKLLNDPTLETVRPDMNCSARIFNLIIHYEIGNYDLVDSLVRNTERYLNKRNSFYEIEKTVVDFIEKVISTATEKEKLAVFSAFRKTLEEAYSKFTEKDRPDYFDFFHWIDSKLEKKTFAEIVKERQKAISRLFT